MLRKDMVKALKKGFPDAENMFNSLILAMNTALVNGEDVHVHNFGTFKAKKSRLTKVYDFKEKKKVIQDGKWKIRFAPSAIVEEVLNKKMREAGR